jgi:hypothetical protein
LQVITYSQSQSFTGVLEQEFNHEDWNAKAAVIGHMGDDSIPIGSCQQAGDDSQRDPTGDDGHTANGGAELQQEDVIPIEVALPDDVAEKAANPKTESAIDQQVQHLRHFFHVSHFFFCLFYIAFLNQVLGSTLGETVGGFVADQ